MYFMGHAALGVLLGLPFGLRNRRGPGHDVMGLTPGLLTLFILSANLPDALHFEGSLRPWTHNFLIGVGLSLALALLLRRPMTLSRWEVAAVTVAGLAHPLGDMTVGHYYPFFPIVPDSHFVAPYAWNGPEDIIMELPLTLFLLLMFQPRLAGAGLRGAWQGRTHPLLRLAFLGNALGLAANVAVFAIVNFLWGRQAGAAVILLFALAVALELPLARAALGNGLTARVEGAFPTGPP